MRGGEADGFGLVDVRGLGSGEPGVELGEGGGGEVGELEGALFVLVCLLGVLVAGGGDWMGGQQGWRGMEGEDCVKLGGKGRRWSGFTY